MYQFDRIRIEAEAILRDSELQRAPSQTRILRYLVDKADDGTASISQYAIATEALGRGDKFDETHDSVVRVQIGRLRRRMREHYRRTTPEDGMYLYIKPGEYRLRLGPLHIAYPDVIAVPAKAAAIAETSPQADAMMPQETDRKSVFSYRWIWLGLAFAVMFQVILFAILNRPRDEAANTPVAELSEAPLVSSELRISADVADQLPASDFRSDIRNDIDRVLQMSLISRTQVDGSTQPADFAIYILLTKGAAEGSMDIFVSMRDVTGALIKGTTLSSVSTGEAPALIRQMIASLISPAGRLSRYLAEEIKGAPANAFECYLKIENYRSQGDDYLQLLNDCTNAYGNSKYGSFFKVRRIFRQIQDHRAKGGKLYRTMAPWSALDELLADEPDNPYANALATKMLIGTGQCEEAAAFAQRGYLRGRTYPALEMTALVEAYGCPGGKAWQENLARRLRVLMTVDADTDSPVLRAYFLLGSLLSDQDLKQGSLVGMRRTTEAGNDLEKFNSAVGRQLEGTATKQDVALIKAVLSQLVWNEYAQWKVRRKIGLD